MPILNYTTSISAEKSVQEIQEVLVEHGATRIMSEYHPASKILLYLSFSIVWNGETHNYKLTANAEGVLKAIESSKSKSIQKKHRTIEHATRVAWRILKDWVLAQMAIIEADVAELPQVFLPYRANEDGTTIYEMVAAKSLKLLE